jgi:hypothetical protein
MNKLHAESPSSEVEQWLFYSRISPPCTESEGSLPCPEKPDTALYPEPVESSHHLPYFFKSHFNIIFSFMPWFSKRFFPLRFFY